MYRCTSTRYSLPSSSLSLLVFIIYEAFPCFPRPAQRDLIIWFRKTDGGMLTQVHIAGLYFKVLSCFHSGHSTAAARKTPIT